MNKMNKLFKINSHRTTDGFSLIECIVVVSILAVLVLILAPYLLQYNEKSRAEKDHSAMNEVVNATLLAMSDASCYDEMLSYSCKNNYITYTDSSGKYGTQLADEEFWSPDGLGEATTITFNPCLDNNGRSYYSMSEAIVNDMTYGNGSVAQTRVMQGAKLKNNQCYLKNVSTNNGGGHLYNSLRKTIGEQIENVSQTYRNSSFTIFIKWEQKDGIATPIVYGQYNGTNLSVNSMASVGSYTSSYDEFENPIPENIGGTTEAKYGQSDLTGSGTTTTVDYKKDNYVELVEKDNIVFYYSTIESAITDINNGDIGKNADTTKENAIVAVFDNGVCSEILLLDDYETQNELVIKSDMIINLNSNELALFVDAALDFSVKTETNYVKFKDGTLSYRNEIEECTASVMKIINTKSDIYVENCNINISGTVSYTNLAIFKIDNGAGTFVDTNINLSIKGGTSCYGIYGASGYPLTIKHCNITIQAQYKNDGSYSARTILSRSENTIVSDCTIITTGIAFQGIGNVNDCTIKSNGHAFFFARNTSDEFRPVSLNIENIKYEYRPMPEEYWYAGPEEGYNYVYSAQSMAIGGSNANDITINMNNCRFDGGNKQANLMRMQRMYNETGGIFRVSNTIVSNYNETALEGEQGKLILNYEDSGHFVYIGRGCNFNENHTSHPNNTYITDAIY